MSTEFGFKELYSVFLKTTLPMEIDGRRLEPGETIVAFDKIQLANFKENRDRTSATGTYDNRTLVVWDETKSIDMTFRQGVFSKTQLSLLTNNKLVQQSEKKKILLSKREELESDESGLITLSQVPADDKIFIYDKQDFNKMSFVRTEDRQHYKIEGPYKEIIVDYSYQYENKTSELVVGQRVFSEYITLEGRTRFKDDITGAVKTGIITIPRLQVTSDLVITVGDGIAPVVGTFSAVGHPIGRKAGKKVMEILFLDDDVDSDIL